MTTWGHNGRRALLRMPRRDWNSLTAELDRRGGRIKEAGAFLLADRAGDRRTVTRVVYLDDLDPTCLTGGISLNGLAISKLWDLCDDEHRVVAGDVHTHPGRSVRQSGLDRANPMVAQRGHVAVIVPNYAAGRIRTSATGVHRYDGESWESWTGFAAACRLSIPRGWWG